MSNNTARDNRINVPNLMVLFLFGQLSLLLTYLKLTHQIDISWFWVVFPLWGPSAIMYGFIVLFVFLVYIFAKIKENW